MDALQGSLTQHGPEIMVVLIFWLLVITFIVFRLAVQQGKYQAKWRDLLKGGTGESLETLLMEQLGERARLQSEVGSLGRRLEKLETALPGSKRHLGLVRYDAFDDVGGNQSFALAIYDDLGNGAVVNSIIGRAECRVYCKPLINGRSERDLSQEEQRAIREAKASGPRSILSPE